MILICQYFLNHTIYVKCILCLILYIHLNTLIFVYFHKTLRRTIVITICLQYEYRKITKTTRGLYQKVRVDDEFYYV